MSNSAVRSQRAWARVAGFLYWAVLVVDLAGLQLHSSVLGRLLTLAGSLLTVPLALGLYYAVRPVNPSLAAGALCFRLMEATLGTLSTLAGFAALQALLSGTIVGVAILRVAHWDDATSFAAFVFTIGSSIFFYLFARSDYIPRILAWWGLFASLLALAACLTHLLRPAFPAMTMYAWVPLLLAETSTGLWLLIKSVDAAKSEATMANSLT